MRCRPWASEKVDTNRVTLYGSKLPPARDRLRKFLERLDSRRRALLREEPHPNVRRPRPGRKHPAIPRHWHMVKAQLKGGLERVRQLLEVRARREHRPGLLLKNPRAREQAS